MSPITYADRFEGITGSAIREIFKIISKPGMISFAGGNPAESALRVDWVNDLVHDALAQNGKSILQYGATEGYPAFRESLLIYIQNTLGIKLQSNQVLPVTGSTQAMDLLCKALINPGDTILVEDPTFLGNMQCMRLYQAKLVPVSVDENGIDLQRLEDVIKTAHPKILYVIPNFQNPTGCTLSLEKRRIISELAEKFDFIIAEDDPYRDLRYRGHTLPSIKSFDSSGHVAYMGSFSKIISPGLRVGYLAANEELIRKCTIGKQSSDLHTANLTQAIVDLFLRKNLLPEHIMTICDHYREQMTTMLAELNSFPYETRFTNPDGGLFIFVTLPDKICANTLLLKCIENNVAFVPGTHFYAYGEHENTLRLNFSSSTVEIIQIGIRILKKALIEMMEETP